MASSSRPLHAMLVIALVYVCALNVLIVHNLYVHYGKRVLSLPINPQTRRAVPPRNHSAPPAVHLRDTDGCAKQQRAVIVLGMPVKGSNDPGAHIPLYSQLRMAFRVAETPPPHVFLAVAADDFMAFHRSWCSSLYSQTKQRTSCELLLQQTTPNPKDVLHSVLERQRCLSHAVTLPDDVSLSSHFLAGLDNLPQNKVSCLALIDVPSTPHASGVCSVAAFYLPRRFITAFVATPETSSIENSARNYRMFFGNRVLIHKPY